MHLFFFFFFALWFGWWTCTDFIYKQNSERQRQLCNCACVATRPVVQICNACLWPKVRLVSGQRSKQPDLDGDNICFQFMNFISRSNLHLQLNQSHAEAPSVGLLECCHYLLVCVLFSKSAFAAWRASQILVASNCITWRRLMAPVKTTGPCWVCVEGKCFFTGHTSCVWLESFVH